MNIRSQTKKASKRISTKINKQYGIIYYDDDNCYPQRILLLSSSSATTKACIDTYGRFIRGGGFKDTTFYKSVINNDGLKTDKLLRFVSKDVATGHGIALHVHVTATGKVTECYPVPLEHVRKTTSLKREETGGEYAIYHDWGGQIGNIKVNEITYLAKFNLDPEVIASQAEAAGGWDQYKGQLVYINLDEGSVYPLASCDAVLESMFAEIQSDVTTTNNVEENFSAKGFFVHKGKFESDEAKEEFEDEIEEFIGPEGARVIVVDVDKEEDVPSFVEIPQTENDKQFEYTDEKVSNKIIRNYLIPKILLSVTDGAGYFNQEQIRDATMYYNEVTSDERLIIEEVFTAIFSNFITNINPSNDYSIIPIEFKVTKDNPIAVYRLLADKGIEPAVKRAALVSIYGLDETQADMLAPDLVAPAEDKRLLVDILGVGGTQALQMIIADATITAEQKKAALMIIFGLSEADAAALAGIVAPTN